MSEAARAAIRGALEKLAPRWVDPPVLQPAALYLELSGEDIRRRAFLVGDDNGQELCLRPDMTAPALRAAFDQGVTAGVIAYEGLVFRRQDRGSARETEFVQIGAEWLGPADDAAIIATALDACGAAGAAPLVKLGDLALVAAAVESCGFAPVWAARVMRALKRPHGLDALRTEIAAADAPLEGAALADALAAVPEADAEAALADMLAMARITPVGGRALGDIARRLRARGEAHRAPKPKDEHLAMLDALLHIDAPVDAAMSETQKLLAKAKGVRSVIDAAAARHAALALPRDARFAPGLGRGLSYYDGFLFELEAPGLGERASLGGGGRYDALVRALKPDAAIAGAGFALRPARLAEAGR